MKKKKPVFPFSAIVGQDAMKEALLLNVINPSIGGVLIRGEKGTAKSTAVRALEELLPRREVVVGCPFRCDWADTESYCSICNERIENGEILEKVTVPMRVIELPLSSTEDRVAGTLDIEYAISTGKKKFEPGVLAQANGNILYVDEVNLLDDHIVDLLLDAAAMGINFVEREGVSFSHPAKFILVGTMNPEEGDLRPQLLDRFGLMVEVKGETDLQKRIEIIKRRIDFERDSESFIKGYQEYQETLVYAISNARCLLPKIKVDDEILDIIVKIALHLDVDGHRADLTILRSAIAIAALQGDQRVTIAHIINAANLSLPHRMRRRPFEEGNLDLVELEAWIREEIQA